MAELKTKANKASVREFLRKAPDAKRRQDCLVLLKLMESVTGSKPLMWGTSIVGFGSYHYVYASGREGDWFLVGFSPRKQDLTIYVTGGFQQSTDLLEKLGKFKSGGGCLYVKTLENISLGILKQIIARSVRRLKNK